MEVSQKIKEERDLLELSIEEFANKLEVSRSTVYRWERDGVVPYYEQARKLGYLTDKKATYFMEAD